MDNKEFFEKAYSGALQKALSTDDDTFIESVKEKAGRNTKRIYGRKRLTVAVIVIFAVIAAVSVSAGAILNWDIASLFSQRLDMVREQRSRGAVTSITAFYPELFGKIPTAEDSSEDSRYEILQRISHSLDETVAYGEYSIRIYGYAFDGTRLDVLYDITYFDTVAEKLPTNVPWSEGYDPSLKEPIGFRLVRGGEQISVGGLNDLISSEDNMSAFRYEAEVFPPAGAEKAELVMYSTGSEPTDIASFEVELDTLEELQLKLSPNVSKTLTSGVTVTVTDVLICPFGAYIEVEADRYSNDLKISQIPIYLLCKDGSVIDVSGINNSTIGKLEEQNDGKWKNRIFLSGRGNVIDINSIESIKLYSEIIKL